MIDAQFLDRILQWRAGDGRAGGGLRGYRHLTTIVAARPAVQTAALRGLSCGVRRRLHGTRQLGEVLPTTPSTPRKGPLGPPRGARDRRTNRQPNHADTSAGSRNQTSRPSSTIRASPIGRELEPEGVDAPRLPSSERRRTASDCRSAATAALSATFVVSASAVEVRSADRARDCPATSANWLATPANGRAPKSSNEPSPAMPSNDVASRPVRSAARREASLARVRLAPACAALSDASDMALAAGSMSETSSARWRSKPVAALSTAANDPRMSAAAAMTSTTPERPKASKPYPSRRRRSVRLRVRAPPPAAVTRTTARWWPPSHGRVRVHGNAPRRPQPDGSPVAAGPVRERSRRRGRCGDPRLHSAGWDAASRCSCWASSVQAHSFPASS